MDPGHRIDPPPAAASPGPRIRSPGWRIALAFGIYLFAANVLLAVFLLARGWPANPDPAAREALAAELRTPGYLAAGLLLQGLAGLITVAFMARAVDRRPLASLGASRGSRIGDGAWGFLLGVVLAAAVVLFIGAVSGRHLKPAAFDGASGAAIALVAAGMAVAAFAEEWLFRGYVYANVRERFSAVRAALFTALVFSLLHVANPGGSTLAWLNVVLVGIVLAELRETTGGILMPLGLHLGWNLTIGMGFGVPVSGYLFPSVLRVALEDLPPVLGGGAFGVEASGVVTVLFGGTALLLGRRMARP